MKFIDTSNVDTSELASVNEPIIFTSPKRRFQPIEIDEMLAMVDLVDIMENEYGLELQNASDNKYKTLCPMPSHRERTPSFFVYTGESIDTFHCYGCQSHGNALTFFQRVEGMSFGEALSKLAVMTGYADVSEEDLLKRTVRHASQAIDEYLSRGDGSGLPGNLNDLEFHTMLSKKLKKIERSYNTEKVTAWVDKIYRTIDDLMAANDQKSINRVWDGLPSTIAKIRKEYGTQ